LYLIAGEYNPLGKTFYDYINSCKNNNLLATTNDSLADVARLLRNLVHLKNESDSKSTLSKSKAWGVLSSIFSIIHDFQ
jgi:hypothetical protein